MNENVTVSLDKAFERLADAAALRDKSRDTASVSRSYYSMYHAAQGALLSWILHFSQNLTTNP